MQTPTDTPSMKESSNDEPLFGAVNHFADEQALISDYQGRLHRANIPPRYKDYLLKDLVEAWQDEAMQEKTDAAAEASLFAIDGFVTLNGGPRHALLFSGDFGTGKTTLACATLKSYMWLHRVDGRFTKFYQFIRNVQSGYGDGTATAVLHAVKTSPVLVIDDIGELERRVSQSENRKELLFEVLDYRNDYLLPTIMTTNLDEKGLIDQFSERTFNRIIEMARLISLEGRNFRL